MYYDKIPAKYVNKKSYRILTLDEKNIFLYQQMTIIEYHELTLEQEITVFFRINEGKKLTKEDMANIILKCSNKLNHSEDSGSGSGSDLEQESEPGPEPKPEPEPDPKPKSKPKPKPKPKPKLTLKPSLIDLDSDSESESEPGSELDLELDLEQDLDPDPDPDPEPEPEPEPDEYNVGQIIKKLCADKKISCILEKYYKNKNIFMTRIIYVLIHKNLKIPYTFDKLKKLNHKKSDLSYSKIKKKINDYLSEKLFGSPKIKKISMCTILAGICFFEKHDYTYEHMTKLIKLVYKIDDYENHIHDKNLIKSYKNYTKKNTEMLLSIDAVLSKK